MKIHFCYFPCRNKVRHIYLTRGHLASNRPTYLLLCDSRHDLLLRHNLLGRDGNRRLLLVILILLGGRRDNLRRRESLLIVNLLLVVEGREAAGWRGRGCGSRLLSIREAVAAERLGDLVRADLDGLPAEAELATREPDTRALDERRQNRALDEDVLQRDIRQRALLVIVDRRLKLAIALAELELERRRVGLQVALRVLGELHRLRVELSEHLARLRAAEPGSRVLHTLVKHELIQAVKRVVDCRRRWVVGRVIVATELEVNRILGGAGLVKDRHAEGRLQRADLHHQRLAIVVEVGLLATRLKRLDRRERNLGNTERGGRDNRGHTGHGLC